MTRRTENRRPWAIGAALALILACAGCASTQNFVADARGGPGARLDPWENWNRKVFDFNEALDRNVLKPIATGYQKVVPQFVRRGVDNFFANAADAWSAINNVLQWKMTPAFEDTVRFTTNTFFGFLGVLDVASEFGLEHHYEDFGQTLGRWGLGPGAYVVLPVLGPSTVRDTAALPLDRLASPAIIIDDGKYRFGIFGLQLINTRARLLGATSVIDDIALDKYTFIRDAYLQRRRSLIYDGDAPEVPDPSSPQQPASAPPTGRPAPAPPPGARPEPPPSPVR